MLNNIKRCSQGHTYYPAIYGDKCPFCGDRVGINFNTKNEETIKLLRLMYNSHTPEILEYLDKNAEKIPAKYGVIYYLKNLIFHRSDGITSSFIEDNLKIAKNECKPEFVTYFQLGKDDYLSILEVDCKKLLPSAQSEFLLTTDDNNITIADWSNYQTIKILTSCQKKRI